MVRVADQHLPQRCHVQQDNPKKGASADRYDTYKHARTLQEILDLGGSRGDIANDVVRGYIVVDDPEVHEAILLTANESERKRLPQHLQAKLPPAGEQPSAPRPKAATTRPAPDAALRPAKVPKKVKGPPPPPRQPGFFLYTSVKTAMQAWDPDAFAGLTEQEAARHRQDTETIATRRDRKEMLLGRLYDDPDEVSAAALQTVCDLVAECATDEPDGMLVVAEDCIVPSENTIRNSGTANPTAGCEATTWYRARITLVADSRRAGLENVAQCVITAKPMWQAA